jgi:hypothetical protein
MSTDVRTRPSLRAENKQPRTSQEDGTRRVSVISDDGKHRFACRLELAEQYVNDGRGEGIYSRSQKLVAVWLSPTDDTDDTHLDSRGRNSRKTTIKESLDSRPIVQHSPACEHYTTVAGGSAAEQKGTHKQVITT